MEKPDFVDKISISPTCLNTLNTLNQTYNNSTPKWFFNFTNTSLDAMLDLNTLDYKLFDYKTLQLC